MARVINCPKCNGDKELRYKNRFYKCPLCKGKGWVIDYSDVSQAL